MAYDQLLKHRDQDAAGAIAVTWWTWERRRFLADARVADSTMYAIRNIEARGHCHVHAYVMMPDHVHCLFTLGGTRSLYIVANPLRAGLVKRIVDYPWWFAEWAPPPFGRADSSGKACD